jgi:hypothetical protein
MFCLCITISLVRWGSRPLLLYHRWDRDPLARAVTKLVSNDKKETVASAPTLQKALTLMTDPGEAQHVHPNHIMIPLDSETKNVLGEPPCVPAFFASKEGCNIGAARLALPESSVFILPMRNCLHTVQECLH